MCVKFCFIYTILDGSTTDNFHDRSLHLQGTGIAQQRQKVFIYPDHPPQIKRSITECLLLKLKVHQNFQGDIIQRFHVCCLEYDGWSHTSLVGLYPPRYTKTPFVSCHETFEVCRRVILGQVVTPAFGELQEFVGDNSANRMSPSIVDACIATTIPISSGHGVGTTNH